MSRHAIFWWSLSPSMPGLDSTGSTPVYSVLGAQRSPTRSTPSFTLSWRLFCLLGGGTTVLVWKEMSFCLLHLYPKSPLNAVNVLLLLERRGRRRSPYPGDCQDEDFLFKAGRSEAKQIRINFELTLFLSMTFGVEDAMESLNSSNFRLCCSVLGFLVTG